MPDSIPSFSFKRFALLLTLVILGLAGTYLYRFLELNITIPSWVIWIAPIVLFVGAFLWYNRGKNVQLIKAIFGNAIIVRKGDGSVSAPCKQCNKRIIYTPRPNNLFVSNCQYCGGSVEFTLSSIEP